MTVSVVVVVVVVVWVRLDGQAVGNEPNARTLPGMTVFFHLAHCYYLVRVSV